MIGGVKLGRALARAAVLGLGGFRARPRHGPTPILRLRWLALAILAAATVGLPGVGFATPSSNADLSSLDIGGLTLSPSFSSGTTNYTATAPSATASVMVTAVTSDANATIVVNAVNPATSGVAYGPVSLNFGSTSIGVTVTAQDGTTTKTYQVDITRPVGGASSDATLSNLTLSSGTLSPSFASATISYTASVTNATSSITVTPTLNDPTASMTVNGSPVTSGSASGSIALSVGANTITIATTAADGVSTLSYGVTVTRASASGTAQTITFANPGAQNFGTAPTLSATASSSLPVSFSSSTTGVCTITSGGALTFVSAGTCTINADQAGDGTYAAATTVTQSFSVVAVAPGAPTLGTATAGDGQATVAFTAPASTGGAAITGYTVTASPGGATGTGSSSPITVTGLTNGTSYTFTVTATNSAGTGSASAASNAVTPATAQTITFANPGAQNFGTTPTLTATASSSLTVSFSSSTTGVCTITSGGALTFLSAGTCTINADQAGNGSFLAATTVTRSFTVNAVAPGAPTIGAVTPGNGQVGVAFTAPASNGGAPITSYTVTSSPGGFTASGSAGPLLVSGLTNGVAYTFTVTATNSAGTGPASAASASATPAVPSNDATLSGLTLSSGTLSPSFASGTTSYTASVDNGVSTLTVTPTVNESHATVKVNGTTVTSGSPSGAISLAVGANTITVLVTAQNGTTTQTYTVPVTRAAAPPPPPPSVTLSALSISGAVVSLDFSPSVTDYTASVGSDITSVAVLGSVPSGESVTVNGQNQNLIVGSFTSGPIALHTGANTITVVASQGSTSKTYTVTITREVPANSADLASVCIQLGPALPCNPLAGFDPATTSYTLQATGQVRIQAWAADRGAAVSVWGGSALTGSSAAVIDAPAGTTVTPVGVTVTSRDRSTTKTYTFVFGQPTASADLSALGVSAGTLAFDPATTDYSVTVSSDTQTFTLTPTTKDPAATFQVKNLTMNQVVSGPVALTAGATTSLVVTVTATNQTTKAYYVTVKRGSPLEVFSPSNLTTKVGTGWVGNYFVRSFQALNWTSTELPPGLTLAPGPRDSTSESKANISGTPTKAGTYSFTVTATSANGVDKGSVTQTLTVLDGPSPVDLASLVLSVRDTEGLPLSPAFDPAVTAYTATTTADSVTLRAFPKASDIGTSVQINDGQHSADNYPLALGANVITFLVRNGALTKTYTVTITRTAAAANANLQGLILGAGGTLGTPFAPDTLAYTATAPHDTTSLQVIAPTADPNAKLKLDGAATTSPMTVALKVGANVHRIAVTSADGTVTKTYTLTVTRASSADLSRLSLVDATTVPDISAPVSARSVSALSPSFNAGTTTYTATATHGVQVVMLGAQAVDSGAIVTVNGARISDEPAQFALNDGDNVFTINVLAADKITSKTYTITVTRAGPALTIGDNPRYGQVGEAYSASLSASGGTGPYTFALARVAGGGDLPKGLSLGADGKLTGKPTSEGSYTFGVTATDSKGATGTGTVTLLILSQITSVTSTVQLQTVYPSTSGSSSQVLVPLVSAGLGTIESHLEANLELSTNTSSAPLAAPAASGKSGKSAGGAMMATAGQAAAASAATGGGYSILTYKTKPNAMGRDTIVVVGTLADGTRGAVAVEFLVPGKASDLTASVAANGIVRLDPTASLIGGPYMGLKILAPPAYGQVSVSGLQLIYTPDPTHLGPTTFVYAVDLGFGLSAPGTVTVTTGQAVTAPSLTATAYAGQKVSLDLTTAAQGGPFTGASVVSISPSTAGTATIRGTGTGTYALDFTPSTSFAGTATVTYALAGAGGGIAEADATITVLSRPDPSLDADLRGLISASDQAVRTFARTQTDNFNSRLESLRSGGGRGGFDMRLGFAAPSSGEDPRDMPGWRLRRLAQQGAPDPTARSADPATGQRATDAPSGLGDAARPKPSAFGSWVAGTIQIGHVDGATRRRDYRLSTSGLSAGVDYRLSDRLVIGAGLGYGEDKAKVGSKGSRLDGESKVGAAYGAWLPRPGVFVDGVLGYGRLSFDVTRYSAEADKLLTGSRSGDMTFGSLRAGYEGRRGALRFSPYGQVSFLDGRLDSFTETGDAAFALRYYDQDVRSLAATLGLKLEGQRKVGRERTLTPRFRVEWRHEFDGVGDQALSYADTAGSQRYVVTGDQLGRDELSYELGGRLQLEHQIAIDLGYRGMFSNSMRSDTWTLRLDHSF